MELTDLPDKKLLRVSEAAAYFSVSERSIRLWIAHGHLTAEKPHGSIFISRESIKQFRLKGAIIKE
jgi:excisionase family DNA binding protein